MNEPTAFAAGKFTVVSRAPSIDEQIIEFCNRENISWYVTAAHRIDGETMFEFENLEDLGRVIGTIAGAGARVSEIADVPKNHHYADLRTL